MDYTYGKEFADAMLGLVNTRYFFRSPSSAEAEWVQREIGQRRDRVFSEQYSYGADTVRDGVSFSKVEEDRYLVNYTDIQMLPNLSCYVTFPGDYPAVRMSMRYEKMKDCAEDLQMRDINDSLDPEVESEITRRTEEEGDVAALLARLDKSGAEEGDTLLTPESPVEKEDPLKNIVRASAAGSVVAAVAAESGESNPVEEKVIAGTQDEIIDMDTGEVLYPGDKGYEDLNEQFNRAFGETQEDMRQEEHNLVVHRCHESEREPLDDMNWG
ncbi:UNVERIFIED_ORG: type IV secretion system coupling TraD/TrwB family protein [Citrobacter freundii]